MRKSIFLFVAGLLSSSFAQPPWLKQLVIDSKNLTFDKQATLAVLLRSADVEFSEKPKCVTHVREVYKILHPDGKDQVDLHVSGSSTLSVENVKGWTVSPDGQVATLTNNDILKMSPFEDYAYYGDSYILAASPAKVRVGSIVAYEYDQEETGVGALFQSFKFQVQQPVVNAVITVKVPRGWDVKYKGINAEHVKIDKTAEKLVASAQNLSYVPEEPFMPPWHYITKQIYLVAQNGDDKNNRSISQWRDVVEWASTAYETAIKPDTSVTNTCQITIAHCTSTPDKISAITEFVQNKIRYVAVELGKGAYQPRPAPQTLLQMYGDCKDKTSLMCAMLTAAGIKAVPALVSASYPVQAELPSPFQFNHAIVAVSSEGIAEAFKNGGALVDGWLFIDPTDPTIMVGDLPTNLQGSRVLPISAGQTELVKLPYDDAKDFFKCLAADAKLNLDGSFVASVKIEYRSNKAKQAQYEQSQSSIEEQMEQWHKIFELTVPASSISDYATTMNGDTARISFQLEGRSYLVPAGPYLLLKPDFFDKPSHIELSAKERHHMIWFGAPREGISRTTWHVPAIWQVEPDSLTIQANDDYTQLKGKLRCQDSTLIYDYHMKYTGYPYSIDEYNQAQEIDKKLSECDGLTVFLRSRGKAQ
jgi:transglutaminase-like putative cysteine protease